MASKIWRKSVKSFDTFLNESLIIELHVNICSILLHYFKVCCNIIKFIVRSLCQNLISRIFAKSDVDYYSSLLSDDANIV